MIDESLRIATNSGKQVLGRISGNEESDTVVIFSHGFGVKSDSRGMFNKICAAFHEKLLTVRFHFVTIDDFTQDTYVTSYTEQIEKLTTVVEKVMQRYPDKKVILIGHSQGCWITSAYVAQAKVLPVKHIMLAPSPTVDVATRMRVKFETREGSVLDEQGTSVLPRTDGSNTFVLPSFWIDAKKINPYDLIKAAAKIMPPVIVWGTNDALRTAENFEEINTLPRVTLYELPNGHDFSEDDAAGLIEVLKKEL